MRRVPVGFDAEGKYGVEATRAPVAGRRQHPELSLDGELAVQTEGIVKRFPPGLNLRHPMRRGSDRLVLDGVSLAVPAGEIFGLIGPNGAGKTTFIKILCGLILPTAGMARVAGWDVVRHEQQVRRFIGLVYGDARSFFWRLTLRENLRFFGALYRMPGEQSRRRIDELVDLVGLSDAADTRMHFFSSGMKQRAAIARGLLTDPPVVFLDEPTAMVDPVAAHEIRRIISERVLDGRRTIFLTTNVMSEAEELCDRVALLRQGRLEQIGGVDLLRQSFQPHESYVLLVGDTSLPAILQLRAIPGVLDVICQSGANGRLTVTLEVARGSRAVPEAIAQLVAISATVWECRQQKLSLDEMFRLAFGPPPAAPETELPRLRKTA